MSEIPSDLLFSRSHEWLRKNDDDTVTIGITDHAQEQLGDLVFVEPPDVGREVSAGEECAVVESVKAASDLYAPASGTVTEVNEALGDSPEIINSDAYGDGWIFKMSLSDVGELDELMNPQAYAEHAAADD